MIAPRSQRLEWPVAHGTQRPHDGMNPNTTWSPGDSQLTPSPTSSTTPAPSCPPMIGGGNGRSPVTTCSSLWHIPEAAILTSTSPALGGSSSMSSTLQGVFVSHKMAALVCMDPPASDASAANVPAHIILGTDRAPLGTRSVPRFDGSVVDQDGADGGAVAHRLVARR